MRPIRAALLVALVGCATAGTGGPATTAAAPTAGAATAAGPEPLAPAPRGERRDGVAETARTIEIARGSAADGGTEPPFAEAPALPAAGAAQVSTVEPPPPSCPAGEVWVPPTGPEGFLLGKGGKHAHRVVLTHGFCLDAGEVSVREYARCVEAGACKEPWKGNPYSTYPARLDYPVNMVSWTKAHAYCSWSGKRLPTEAEWEWAATGPEQARYPWGNEPEPSCETVDYTKFGAPKWEAGGDIGCGGGGPSPVGAHPRGDRVWPGGAVHDLAGNVWEWVEDSYAPYAADPVTDPVVRSEVAVHTLRGGGWNRSYAAMVVTYRGAAHYAYQVPALGFRCARGERLASPSPTYE